MAIMACGRHSVLSNSANRLLLTAKTLVLSLAPNCKHGRNEVANGRLLNAVMALLLQASDAVEAADGPAPATGSCACQPISPDALLAKLDDLDQPARLATGTAATGGVAGMLHLPQLLQAT